MSAPGESVRAAEPHDPSAARLRGFGPAGLAALLVILAGALLGPLVAAALVIVWAHVSGTPWCALGFRRPASWTRTVLLGVLGGAALKLIMKALVMPLLGAPIWNGTYQDLAGNRAAIPGMLFAILVVAGVGEETFYRGYLFERLGRAIGTGPAARAATVVLTSALFAAAHYADQGLPGVEQALFTGLAFGAAYAATGALWGVMIAHASFDLVAYALTYWRLEGAVDHLIFE